MDEKTTICLHILNINIKSLKDLIEQKEREIEYHKGYVNALEYVVRTFHKEFKIGDYKED